MSTIICCTCARHRPGVSNPALSICTRVRMTQTQTDTDTSGVSNAVGVPVRCCGYRALRVVLGQRLGAAGFGDG